MLMSPYVFLLGGHDLEMIEIRDWLVALGVPFYDRHLSWHDACLGAYADLFTSFGDRIPVGVELRTDISPPPGYRLIDHHNERVGEPASIEQVADMLGLALDRRRQLVAANDKGYIPAMEALGATPEEIAQIRREDRAAQGVSADMEASALRDIETRQQVGALTCVATELGRFSPIADQLYGVPRLLIHNTREAVYYGQDLQRLIDHYREDIGQGRVYHGGGPQGFLGLAAGAWTSSQLVREIQIIIQLMQ